MKGRKSLAKPVKPYGIIVQEGWKHPVSTERNQFAEILHFQIKESAILKQTDKTNTQLVLLEHFQREVKSRMVKDNFKKQNHF